MFCTDYFKYDDDNSEIMISALNMMLEIFGFCHVIEENTQLIEQLNSFNEIEKVSWNLLETKPGISVKWNEIISKFYNKKRKGVKQKEVVISRLGNLSNLGLDAIATGESGFQGYVVFEHPDKNIYVLDSIFSNNAIYIFKDEWKNFSRLSKAQVLNGNLQYKRLIHHPNWVDELSEVLKAV